MQAVKSQTGPSALTGSAGTTLRESNIELLRILSILLILAYHYVVNSGFADQFNLSHITGNMVFLQLYECLGIVGVNCFTLITGYFMVQKSYSIRKVLQLWLEIWFYRIAVNLFMLLLGYGDLFTAKYIVKTVFSFVFNVNEGYVSSMLCMYLLIPFLNILVRNMSRTLHLALLCILILVYSLIPTFAMRGTWHYVVWLCIMYLVGGYIRSHPGTMLRHKKRIAVGAAGSIGLIFASVLVIDRLHARLGYITYNYMSYPASKFLPFLASVFLFLLFLGLHIKPNRWINRMAASSFGVVLIHGNGEIMRRFLWVDLLKNTSYYESPLLVLHALGSLLAIYLVCTLIDMARIRFMEKPLLYRLGKNADSWLNRSIGRIDAVLNGKTG